MAIDKRFRRIADQLRTYELVREDSSAPLTGEPTSSSRFVGFYSRAGLTTVLEAYGITERLCTLGYDQTQIVIHQRDPFTHRFELLDGAGAGDHHRLIDLQLHLHRIRAAELDFETAKARANDHAFDMLAVEWLCLQNPRAEFDADRPRFPGQMYPGLGLAYVLHNVILLMARRIGRDGVLNVPQQFHLALLFEKAGYRFVCPEHRHEVHAAARAVRSLRLAAAGWAVARGCVQVVRPDAAPAPWQYEPAEMIAPVADRLGKDLRRRERQLRRSERDGPFEMELDVEQLQQSLRDDPVEGLAADAIFGPDPGR